MKVEIGPYPGTGTRHAKSDGRTPTGRPKREVSVEIHDHDTWSADFTLALVAAPLLRYFRDEAGGRHAIGSTDPQDFPETGDPAQTHDADRWSKLLDELVWTFEEIAKDDLMDRATETRVQNGLYLFGKYYRCLWT
ncbi:MAG: hypothetical protein OXG35_21370 [Acidobacteria bacterium]|nr:hypothetical protein [Acidobacteriota bacterium]